MIALPTNWETIGQEIHLSSITSRLKEVLSKIDCNNLAYSGGIDSSILLYYLLAIGKRPIQTFTITCSDKHPDIEYSHKGIGFCKSLFGDDCINGHWFIRPNSGTGDDLVKIFYSIISNQCSSIIAGDGIDEFMCGYYMHQTDPTEETYYKYLRRLYSEQLLPLHQNSASVKVYLPYLDNSLVDLYWQIPITQKVGPQGRKLTIQNIARGIVHEDIITRRKYGFCTAA